MLTLHYIWYTLLGLFAILQALIIILPLGYYTLALFAGEKPPWPDKAEYPIALLVCGFVGALSAIVIVFLLIGAHTLGVWLKAHF